MNSTHLCFLADESCDFAVVRSLRQQGYDVVAVGESAQRSTDRAVIDLAKQESRILLTEDKDFGWLVFVGHTNPAGVILIRYPGNARRALAAAVKDLVQAQGDRLIGAFVVLQPGIARINRIRQSE
jgi:predicted nuclease of predicted toxin-antitoxin system